MASCPGLPSGASIVGTPRVARTEALSFLRDARAPALAGVDQRVQRKVGGDCSEAAVRRGHTAPKALGRDVPQLLLAQADEVIE